MLRAICQIAIQTSVPTSWEPYTVDLGESTITVAKLGLAIFFVFRWSIEDFLFTVGLFGLFIDLDRNPPAFNSCSICRTQV